MELHNRDPGQPAIVPIDLYQRTMNDVEASRWTPTDGFAAVSAFIARDPDHETYVFRKFKRLTARTLLHLQSELVDLEYQLDELDHEAENSKDKDLRRSMRNWEVFKSNAATRDKVEGRRKRLFDGIEATLRKYHEILTLESDVAKLEGPSDRVLRHYFKALKGSKNGDDPKLGGRSETVLDDRQDLVALNHPQNTDLLSKFFLNYGIFPATKFSSNTGNPDEAHYFELKSLRLVVNIISTAVAALLLIGSILALYFVQNPHSKLGILIMFIVLFAIGLGLTTNANRDSIFAATAAYAAVLVVFVSGNLGKAKAD
jgi:hypothetical protein